MLVSDLRDRIRKAQSLLKAIPGSGSEPLIGPTTFVRHLSGNGYEEVELVDIELPEGQIVFRVWSGECPTTQSSKALDAEAACALATLLRDLPLLLEEIGHRLDNSG